MSEREQFTADLADALRKLRDWSAPYGILVGLSSGSGRKYREIAFGIACTLDATIKVYSPTFIVLESIGPMAASESPKKFNNSADLLAFLKAQYVGETLSGHEKPEHWMDRNTDGFETSD